MSSPPRPQPDLTCTQCGQPEAQAVGDEVLCAACLHARGSCGAGRESEPDTGQTSGTPKSD